MYLEERVEKLEQAAIDQVRQTDIIAKGLANLTVDVRAIRQDVNGGFEQVKLQFDDVKLQFSAVNKRLDEMQLTQQLILKLLTERLT